jgi:hypothetical protein
VGVRQAHVTIHRHCWVDHDVAQPLEARGGCGAAFAARVAAEVVEVSSTSRNGIDESGAAIDTADAVRPPIGEDQVSIYVDGDPERREGDRDRRTTIFRGPARERFDDCARRRRDGLKRDRRARCGEHDGSSNRYSLH